MAIAVSTGRVAYVLLIDGVLCDWGGARSAGRGALQARRQAHRWFLKLRPDIVVTEDVAPQSRKSLRTRAVISAINSAAAEAQLFDISVPRVQRHANKYDEARALAERFPEIAAWVPKPRRLWEGIAPKVLYFEALALAAEVLEGPSDKATDIHVPAG
jgi:hypothetical protein